MNGRHFEEEAALYALGLLDADETTRLEAHVRECRQCAQAVGRAEADLTAMASAETQRRAPAELELRIARTLGVADAPVTRRRPSVRFLAAAVAAAFVIGMIPAAYFWQQNRTMENALVAENGALNRVAQAPHRVAAFASPNGGDVARVMYGRDGSWYFVMIPHASKPLQLAWMHDGQKTMLGDAMPHGDMATLYLPRSHRMDRLALMDGPTVVAEAQLTYE